MTNNINWDGFEEASASPREDKDARQVVVDRSVSRSVKFGKEVVEASSVRNQGEGALEAIRTAGNSLPFPYFMLVDGDEVRICKTYPGRSEYGVVGWIDPATLVASGPGVDNPEVSTTLQNAGITVQMEAGAESVQNFGSLAEADLVGIKNSIIAGSSLPAIRELVEKYHAETGNGRKMLTALRRGNLDKFKLELSRALDKRGYTGYVPFEEGVVKIGFYRAVFEPDEGYGGGVWAVYGGRFGQDRLVRKFLGKKEAVDFMHSINYKAKTYDYEDGGDAKFVVVDGDNVGAFCGECLAKRLAAWKREGKNVILEPVEGNLDVQCADCGKIVKEGPVRDVVGLQMEYLEQYHAGIVEAESPVSPMVEGELLRVVARMGKRFYVDGDKVYTPSGTVYFGEGQETFNVGGNPGLNALREALRRKDPNLQSTLVGWLRANGFEEVGSFDAVSREPRAKSYSREETGHQMGLTDYSDLLWHGSFTPDGIEALKRFAATHDKDAVKEICDNLSRVGYENNQPMHDAHSVEAMIYTTHGMKSGSEENEGRLLVCPDCGIVLGSVGDDGPVVRMCPRCQTNVVPTIAPEGAGTRQVTLEGDDLAGWPGFEEASKE